jgi:hypothetical protein
MVYLFLDLVWQRLEEENRDFFKAYYARLMLMNQIVSFNKLLEQQHQIMNKDHHYGMPAMPSTAPNGSNTNMCKLLFFSSCTSVLTDIFTIISFCQNVTMEVVSSNIVHCCLSQ